jgi:hypothetical protein
MAMGARATTAARSPVTSDAPPAAGGTPHARHYAAGTSRHRQGRTPAQKTSKSLGGGFEPICTNQNDTAPKKAVYILTLAQCAISAHMQKLLLCACDTYAVSP